MHTQLERLPLETTKLTETPPVCAKNNDTPNDPAEIAAITNWHTWCRLCAKDDPHGNISVFLKDEKLATGSAGNNCTGVMGGSSDFSLPATIQQYFLVNILCDEALPQMICTECFSLVTSLANFSERVSKVQQMYRALHSSPADMKLDLRAIRLKYGLLDEEREHVLIHLLPEVHYFEAKPKISELEEQTLETELENTLPNPLEHSNIRIRIKTENLLKGGRDETEEETECQEEEENEKDPFLGEEDPVNDGEYKYNNSQEQDSSTNSENDDYITEKQNIEIELEDLANELPQKSTRTGQIRRCRHLKPLKSEEEILETSASDDDVGVSTRTEHKTRSKSESFICTECSRKFKRIQQFRQHMERMHCKTIPRRSLQCSDCKRNFNTKYQLEKHSKIHLPLQHKKVIPCPYCSKKFASNTSVQTHIKYIHMNERPFICEECGVAVRTNAALKTHMLTHTDYAPFVCEICKKGFKNQIRLKNHMETHDPNKHICAECGLQLNSRATLNRHLLVHSDEMQHKCDYCGRAFKRAKALKNHLILHTGLKPYSCDFCDRTFANGSNCRSHKKKAHPDELAALEASGGGRQYTRNIPKLEALKAVTKATDNLAPVVSKQSGCFAFGKKPKTQQTKDDIVKHRISKSSKQSAALINHLSTSSCSNSQVDFNNLHSALAGTTIPTIDNIYSHIMKKVSITEHNAKDGPTTPSPAIMQIKRPPSQSSSCIGGEQDTNTSDLPRLQLQQHHIHLELQQDHAHNQQATAQNFYTQVMKQSTIPHDEHVAALLAATAQQHEDLGSTRSPDSQTSHVTTNDGHSNASTHFYVRQSLPGPFI